MQKTIEVSMYGRFHANPNGFCPYCGGKGIYIQQSIGFYSGGPKRMCPNCYCVFTMQHIEALNGNVVEIKVR